MSYYRLQAHPFERQPDPRFFFDAGQQRSALAALEKSLLAGGGFTVITGGEGMGKTAILDFALSRLDSGQLTAARLVAAPIGPDDMLHEIASVFGLDCRELGGAEIRERLATFFIDCLQAEKRPVLFIDQCERLLTAALRELAALADIRVDDAQVPHIVLLGRSQLRQTLAGEDFMTRTHNRVGGYHLQPLESDDARRLIEHRLRAVGWQGDPDISNGAFEMIFLKTGGVPGRITAFCADLLAFASANKRHSIGNSIIRKVSAEQQKARLKGGRGDAAALRAEGSGWFHAPESQPGAEPSGVSVPSEASATSRWRRAITYGEYAAGIAITALIAWQVGAGLLGQGSSPTVETVTIALPADPAESPTASESGGNPDVAATPETDSVAPDEAALAATPGTEPDPGSGEADQAAMPETDAVEPDEVALAAMPGTEPADPSSGADSEAPAVGPIADGETGQPVEATPPRDVAADETPSVEPDSPALYINDFGDKLNSETAATAMAEPAAEVDPLAPYAPTIAAEVTLPAAPAARPQGNGIGEETTDPEAGLTAELAAAAPEKPNASEPGAPSREVGDKLSALNQPAAPRIVPLVDSSSAEQAESVSLSDLDDQDQSLLAAAVSEAVPLLFEKPVLEPIESVMDPSDVGDKLVPLDALPDPRMEPQDLEPADPGPQAAPEAPAPPPAKPDLKQLAAVVVVGHAVPPKPAVDLAQNEPAAPAGGIAASPGLTVTAVTLTRGVVDKEPVDATDWFAAADGAVYAFARIKNPEAPTQVTFAWYRGDLLAASAKLKVGQSASWRTWSKSRIQPGNWRVTITDESGKLLAENAFTVE